MSKLTPSAQSTFCSVLVDELARGGVRHAVVCPGSRSTPLAMALAADDRIEVQVRLDERSAAFVALGIGLASGMPAVLLTTSGTAAAETHAAVIEAHQARVPLLVCRADRPPELHGVGAPQTVVQAGLFGGAVRFACDLGVPDVASAPAWRSLASRLLAEACASPAGPGPVHLNVAFRDPLDAPSGELPAGRSDGRPWHAVRRRPDTRDDTLAELLSRARRPLIVAGAGCGDPDLLLGVASALGIPLLADPRSGCRSTAAETPVVAAADALLRSDTFAAAHRPDLVVRIGEAWASKVLNAWLSTTAAAGAEHVLVDPYGEWRDPAREVATVLRARPEDLLRGLTGAGMEPDERWADSWREAEGAAQAAVHGCLEQLANLGELSEPLVSRTLAAHPGIDTLVVASSMPIRDLEWFSAPRAGYPGVLANRGANGIDGVVSTTMGVAASAAGSDRGPIVGLVGDLAFLHDLTALVRPISPPESERGFGTGHPCGLVVVDNGGGGIFSFLGQARSVERGRFEQLFGTPQSQKVAALAGAAGCAVFEASNAKGFAAEIDSWWREVVAGAPAVLVCTTDRQRNVAVHDELNSAVARALEA